MVPSLWCIFILHALPFLCQSKKTNCGGTDCIVDCTGGYACWHDTVEGNFVNTVSITCDGNDACSELTVNCDNSMQCQLNCNGTVSNSCSPLTILNCGTSDCILNCGIDSPNCQNISIPDISQANSFNCVGLGCPNNINLIQFTQSPTSSPMFIVPTISPITSIPTQPPSPIPTTAIPTQPTQQPVTSQPTSITSQPTIPPTVYPTEYIIITWDNNTASGSTAINGGDIVILIVISLLALGGILFAIYCAIRRTKERKRAQINRTKHELGELSGTHNLDRRRNIQRLNSKSYNSKVKSMSSIELTMERPSSPISLQHHETKKNKKKMFDDNDDDDDDDYDGPKTFTPNENYIEPEEGEQKQNNITPTGDDEENEQNINYSVDDNINKDDDMMVNDKVDVDYNYEQQVELDDNEGTPTIDDGNINHINDGNENEIVSDIQHEENMTIHKEKEKNKEDDEEQEYVEEIHELEDDNHDIYQEEQYDDDHNDNNFPINMPPPPAYASE